LTNITRSFILSCQDSHIPASIQDRLDSCGVYAANILRNNCGFWRLLKAHIHYLKGTRFRSPYRSSVHIK
jgi:hypothetical protein